MSEPEQRARKAEEETTGPPRRPFILIEDLPVTIIFVEETEESSGDSLTPCKAE